MAIELKCPDCGSKLRLKRAPEPGTEIECPECAHVFSAPRVDDDEAPAPKKKKAADDGEAKKDEAEKPKKKEKKDDKKNQPKRRRAKKKETNKALLIGMIVFGLMVLGLVVTMLVWFLGRKPAAYEMMNYLPEDAHSVTGLNVTHIQKYPEFFKSCEQTYANKGFKKAADAFAKALGSDTNDILDYMLYSETTRGDAIVLRTKKEYDVDALSKLPGAKKQSAEGKTYYTIYDIDGMSGITSPRVFAATNRIVVFCAGSIPDNVFRGMLKGHEGSDKSMNVRAGALGKRVTRGTWWGLRLIDGATNKPAPPSQGKNAQGQPMDSGGNEVKEIASTTTNSAKGYGFKVSVGSRTMRLEVDVWMRDDEAANNLYTKFKDSNLAKGDEEEPPRWWKQFMQGMGDRKVGNELLTNVGAKASGEVFILYSELDTKLMMTALGSLVTKVVGNDQQTMAPGGAGGLAPPPGGGVGQAGGINMPGGKNP